MNKTATLILTMLITASSALPAAAQQQRYDRAMEYRLQRLERDLQYVQRQAATGQTDIGSYQPSAPTGTAMNAESRLTSIEEQMRKLQGRVEELDYAIRQQAETAKRLQEDMEFRLQELEKGGMTPQPAATAAEGPATVRPSEAEAGTVGDPKADGAAPADVPTQGALGKQADTPEGQYKQAFTLLNQTKYAEARSAFQKFVQEHPKDPLVGNAWYWLGETYYVDRDYVQAADKFRQGFESMPKGPKAPDNMLKMALSLSGMKQVPQSCVVLKKLIDEYGGTAKDTAARAQSERQRL